MGTGHWAVPGVRREAGWPGSLQQTFTCFPGPQEADGLTLGRPEKLLWGWLERQQSWKVDLEGWWKLPVSWG